AAAQREHPDRRFDARPAPRSDHREGAGLGLLVPGTRPLCEALRAERNEVPGRGAVPAALISSFSGRFPLFAAFLSPGLDGVLAYVGPGAGLELVGYFMALLVSVGVALFTVLLWPFYALRQRIRAAKRGLNHEASAPDALAESKAGPIADAE